MSEYIQEITFEQARKLAEDAAVKKIGKFRDNCEIPVLREEYVEAECCLFFFGNKHIQISESFFWKNCAYAISKKGQVRLIVDFSDDPIKLKEYLEKFSEHLKENNE